MSSSMSNSLSTKKTTAPIGWRVTNLGDCCFVTKLAGFEYTEYFDYSIGGEIIVIRGLNIKGGNLDLTDVHTVSRSVSNSLPRSRLNRGDLVMGYVGTIGNVALIDEDEKYHLAPNVARISPDKKVVYPQFLQQQMQGLWFQYSLLALSGTTSQPALSMENLRKAPVLLPPLPEQRQIAAILGTWDEAIRLTADLIAAKQQRKKGLMQRLLSGELRFPGFEGRPWREVSVGTIADATAGGTPNTNRSEFWKDGTVPWMRSGEVHKKRVYNVSDTITQLGMESSNAKLIPPNSILIALAGQGKTRGTVAINKIELTTNQSIAAIIPDPTQIYYEYLFYDLDGRYDELRRLSAGDGGRGGLNLALIKGLSLRLPSIEEQKKVAAILNACDQELDLLQQKLAALQQQKKGLMQRLLTGQVRVKV